jgi:hypothetical protein
VADVAASLVVVVIQRRLRFWVMESFGNADDDGRRAKAALVEVRHSKNAAFVNRTDKDNTTIMIFNMGYPQ